MPTINPWTLLSALIAPASFAAPEPTRASDPARALRLDLTLESPTTIEPGADVLIKARLVNTSRETVHLVRPGDGSEMGWREPWVHYSGTRVAPDGTTSDVPAAMSGRCGLFDVTWQDDIVALAPGAELDLHTWIPDPSHALALDQPGTVQIRMHYQYRAGQGGRGAIVPPDSVPAELAGVAPFEVVSAPITIVIKSPLTLIAELRPGAERLRAGKSASLSDLFTLRVVNTSRAPVTVTTPGSPSTFRFETRPGGYVPGFELPMPGERPEKVTLAPGAELRLLGPGARFSRSPNGTWTPATAGPITLYAVFDQYALGRIERRLVSAPLTLVVR